LRIESTLVRVEITLVRVVIADLFLAFLGGRGYLPPLPPPPCIRAWLDRLIDTILETKNQKNLVAHIKNHKVNLHFFKPILRLYKIKNLKI
jgi:hypothetical protein